MNDPREQVQDVREWTLDAESRLAAFMGWRQSVKEDGVHPGVFWINIDDGCIRGEVEAWCPLYCADDDLQVLERAREVWGVTYQWTRFQVAYASAIAAHAGVPAIASVQTHAPAAVSSVLYFHACGDWSRAVLAVLRSTEGEEKP